MSNPQNTEWMAQATVATSRPRPCSPALARETIARAVCAACPVRQTCLDYALLHRIDHGLGGHLGGGRRRMAAAHRRPPGPAPADRLQACSP